MDREILEFIEKAENADWGEARFQALALKIFNYQFKRNKNYRNFCRLEGRTPETVRGWKDIPAMPTVGFKELILASFPIKKTVKVFRTSGTTWGESRGAHFFDTLKLYEAAILPAFKKHLLPDNAECSYFFLVCSPENAPDSSLSYMMGVVNRVFAQSLGKFYVGAYCIRPNLRSVRGVFNTPLLRDLKNSKKPVFILATVFSLKSFLDYLEVKRIRLRLKAGSRLMETGGFKGRSKEISKSRLCAQCERLLGIPKNYCVSEYGMTELSSQFYDAVAGAPARRRIFHGPAWVRTLVIDPKTGREAKKGKIGMLRHFDLANRGSVMAVQTEDLGRTVGGGFQLLGRASGAELRGCSLSYEEFLEAVI